MAIFFFQFFIYNFSILFFLALADEESEWKPRKDDYYDLGAERKDKSQHESERKKTLAKQGYIKRVIVHPNFKNIDFKRAERILDNREKDRSDVGEVEYSQGDVIIRPSSKGNLMKNFIVKPCII